MALSQKKCIFATVIIKTEKIMANTKLLLVEDDENLAYMEKSCFEDIIGGYEVLTLLLYLMPLELVCTYMLYHSSLWPGRVKSILA